MHKGKKWIHLNCIRKVARKKVKKIIKRKEVKNYKKNEYLWIKSKRKKEKIKEIPKRKEVKIAERIYLNWISLGLKNVCSVGLLPPGDQEQGLTSL